MIEEDNDIYLSLSSSELNAGVFRKSNNNLIFSHSQNYNDNLIDEDKNFERLESIIEKNIKKIEKDLNSFVSNISIMIETNETNSVYISLMKKLDDKKIQQKDIKYLIQDAKSQIIKAYPNKDIIHIIIKKYLINDSESNFIPYEQVCNKISLDIEFICITKTFVKKIENLFAKLQVNVKKIICLKYVKSLFLEKYPNNICEIGYNLSKGFNKQEVVIIPKKIEKKGFFEKLFHFFN